MVSRGWHRLGDLNTHEQFWRLSCYQLHQAHIYPSPGYVAGCRLCLRAYQSMRKAARGCVPCGLSPLLRWCYSTTQKYSFSMTKTHKY